MNLLNLVNNGQKVPQAILLPSVIGEQCVEEYNFFEYECISAAQSVGGVLRNGVMFMGAWAHTPPGCFINPRDNVIHFSRNSDGMNNGGYSAVCKPMVCTNLKYPIQSLSIVCI